MTHPTRNCTIEQTPPRGRSCAGSRGGCPVNPMSAASRLAGKANRSTSGRGELLRSARDEPRHAGIRLRRTQIQASHCGGRPRCGPSRRPDGRSLCAHRANWFRSLATDEFDPARSGCSNSIALAREEGGLDGLITFEKTREKLGTRHISRCGCCTSPTHKRGRLPPSLTNFLRLTM